VILKRRPSGSVLALGILGLIGLIGVIVLIGGTGSGADRYSVTMRLANAGGLSDGSPVSIGGVEVGDVRLESTQDHVDARLQIKPQYAPLDRRVRATIIARNALGQKQVLLTPRSGALQPAADGYRLPAVQVDSASDLDQLLGTLDPDTRARLAVLLNESGMAFAGRKVDFKTLLNDLGPALSRGSDLLGQVTQDNQALGNLLQTSDRFIATMAGQRRRLSTTVDLLGRTTETVADRRVALRQTLQSAPAALSSARAFLAELRRTTGPLASTARRLRATAPPLLATVDTIEPFRQAAKPTLDAAVQAAPTLTRLARRTTGSLRGALPALDSVEAASQHEIPPVGTALDGSMDNLLATVENWSHAIQFSDGPSHVFRGEAGVAPSLYERILAGLGAPLPTPGGETKKTTTKPATPPSDASSPPPQTPAAAKPVVPEAVKKIADKVPVVGGVVQGLDRILGGLLGAAPSPGDKPSGKDTSSASDLLDFLLGN
jgi:phospholipid/cholesterol/gamma-HCH transport system substrate-binding protein